MTTAIAETMEVRAPSAVDLMAAWEWGLPRSLPERAAVLLATLLPGRDGPALLRLSRGERDFHLLRAHELLFGADLDCVVDCPSCSSSLEVSMGVSEILEHTSAPVPSDQTGEIEEAGWRVRFRMLDSRDLIEAASSRDPAVARQTLLSRSILTATPPEGIEVDGLPPADLPPAVVATVLDELERRDPLGAVDLGLTCPECGHLWRVPFDVVSYLWAEIDGWACRTLREVHLLASAYGWRENDILALSAWRRHAYLEMSGRG